MNLICKPTGPLAANTYIIWNDNSTDAVVIDPASSRRVISLLRENNLNCSAILITHGHFDHIMGVAELKKSENATVYMNELEADALMGGEHSLAHMGGVLVSKTTADVLLSDGMRFNVAGFDFFCVHTPGHSPGSTCFVLEKECIIFSGDTLFRLSVGRTDFDGGSSKQLYNSIASKLFALSGDYRVLPGHDRETSLDFERKHNPFIRNGGFDF